LKSKSKTKRISVRLRDPHDVLRECLAAAIERGMDRHDKYHDVALLEVQRSLLFREIESSWWLALDDAHVEIR
jgi:hypothetical protein